MQDFQNDVVTQKAFVNRKIVSPAVVVRLDNYYWPIQSQIDIIDFEILNLTFCTT